MNNDNLNIEDPLFDQLCKDKLDSIPNIGATADWDTLQKKIKIKRWFNTLGAKLVVLMLILGGLSLLGYFIYSTNTEKETPIKIETTSGSTQGVIIKPDSILNNSKKKQVIPVKKTLKSKIKTKKKNIKEKIKKLKEIKSTEQQIDTLNKDKDDFIFW